MVFDWIIGLEREMTKFQRTGLGFLLLAAGALGESNPGASGGGGAFGQPTRAATAARHWRETHERPIVGEFIDLLAMPNLARDAAGIRKNAAAVAATLGKRGAK